VPLSRIQREILGVLAAQRNPGSYIAGSSPLNESGPRYSLDIDIFHDRQEAVARAALRDVDTLSSENFAIAWIRRDPAIHTARVSRAGENTKLEWAADSDYRFFPTVAHEMFGWVLHPVDLATNKVAAAYGRREPRDIVDLITVHEHILPLGAAVWAAADKAPGFTPEGIINEIRRMARYTAAELAGVDSDPPVDPAAVTITLRRILDEAETFVLQMPTAQVGRVYLLDGQPVQPNPESLDRYQTHTARRQGHWPSNVEISAAMVDYYRKRH
jgi:hypothetical protein